MDDSGGGSSSEEEGGPLPESLAFGVAALQSQLQEAQAAINALLKKQQEVRQPLIHPGGGPRPTEAGKPW